MSRAGAAGGSLPAAVLVVALGGMIGSTGRYLLDAGLSGTGPWPWSTLAVNVTGCLAIGGLSRWIARRDPHPLLRPFLVVGVLGGYTTFSAFTVQVVTLADGGDVVLAATYLVLTLVACFAAVALAARLVDTRVPERGQET